MSLYHLNNSCCWPSSIYMVFVLQKWYVWHSFPLPAFAASSCPMQGCLPPSLPLLLGLLCISCSGFQKFCCIIFLAPCPFPTLPMPHTSNMIYWSFFGKSDIRKVVAAPNGWESSGRQAELLFLLLQRGQGEPSPLILCTPAASHPMRFSHSVWNKRSQLFS